MDWSKTRVASRFLFGEGFHDFFRSDGDFIDPHTDSVVDGVGNRRHDRQKRALTNFLRAKRPARIRLFNQLSNHFRHVERGRALVFQNRRKFMNESVRKFLGETAKLLLFHERFAEAHVDAPFNLAPSYPLIQAATDVIPTPDLSNLTP